MIDFCTANVGDGTCLPLTRCEPDGGWKSYLRAQMQNMSAAAVFGSSSLQDLVRVRQHARTRA
eukprot:3206011-Prymnesium_polylepis.1